MDSVNFRNLTRFDVLVSGMDVSSSNVVAAAATSEPSGGATAGIVIGATSHHPVWLSRHGRTSMPLSRWMASRTKGSGTYASCALAGVVLGLACIAVLAWVFVARWRRRQQFHDALLLPTVVSTHAE